MPPLLLLILAFFLPSLVYAQASGGLTFEACLSNLGCAEPRKCLDVSTFGPCKADSRDSSCECVPPKFTPCTSSSNCTEGEVCARSLHVPFVCTSEMIAVPPGGPTTAEETNEHPFIPDCPRPKRSDRDRKSVKPILSRQQSKKGPSGSPFKGPQNPSPLDAPPDFEPVPVEPGGPPPDVSDIKPNGLNMDICRPGTCAKDLSCVNFDGAPNFAGPNDGGRGGRQAFRCCEKKDALCFCHPVDSRPVCQSTADCSPGELCIKTPITPPTCMAKSSLKTFSKKAKERMEVFKGNQPGKPGKRVPLVKTPTPSPDAIEETPEDTPEVSEAATVPPKRVESSPAGTVTPTPSPSVEATVLATPETNGEASPEAEAEAETQEEEDGICVDAEALRHLDEQDVVFEQDRLGRVLCDVNGSCATTGHIVMFNGNAMMMRSYCDMVGCEEKVIKVNSPRYRRGLKVDSQTEGLCYTALAARYGTRIEEGILVGVVHIGL